MFNRKERMPVVDAPGKTIITIIGNGMEGTGRLFGKGSVRIDGKYEGDIEVDGDVVIGQTGSVIGNIKASALSIAGALHGDTSISGKLEVLPTGTLIGDAKIGSLVIEEGAMLKGHCEIVRADKGTSVSNVKVKDSVDGK